MSKPLETKTLWQSPDDDVVPMVEIEASMHADQDYDPNDQDFDSPADREDFLARFRRDDFAGVGIEVEVSLNGVVIGEGSAWSVEHGQVTADVNADAWEISPTSPLSSAVAEALAAASAYLDQIEAGQPARDALKAAQQWADPHNPKYQPDTRPVNDRHLTDIDPDEALKEIRELIVQDAGSELARDDVATLIDRVDKLDQWLSHGGTRPAEWRRIGKEDQIIVAFNPLNREYSVSARASEDDEWSTFEGAEHEIDTLMSMARDVMTGG